MTIRDSYNGDIYATANAIPTTDRAYSTAASNRDEPPRYGNGGNDHYYSSTNSYTTASPYALPSPAASSFDPYAFVGTAYDDDESTIATYPSPQRAVVETPPTTAITTVEPNTYEPDTQEPDIPVASSTPSNQAVGVFKSMDNNNGRASIESQSPAAASIKKPNVQKIKDRRKAVARTVGVVGGIGGFVVAGPVGSLVLGVGGGLACKAVGKRYERRKVKKYQERVAEAEANEANQTRGIAVDSGAFL